MTATPTRAPAAVPPPSAARPRSTRPAAIVVVAAFVAAGAGAVLALPAPDPWRALAVLVAVWLLGLGWTLRRPVLPLGLLALEVWAGLNVVAGAVVAVATGETLLGTYDLTAGTVGALRLWSVALAAVLAGAVVATVLADERAVAGRPAGSRRSGPDGHPAPLAIGVPAAVLDRWALTCLALGVASLVGYAVLSGAGLGALNVLAGEGTYGGLAAADGASAVGVLKALAGVAGVGAVLAVVRLVADRRSPAVPLAVVVGAVALLAGPGGRARLVIPVAVAVVVWLRTSRSRPAAHPRRLLLVGTAALFAFAAVVGAVRGQADKELDLGAAVAKEARGGVFPATAGLVTAVPDRHPELGLDPAVDAVVLVVPRALWPDKPTSSLVGVQVAVFGQNIGASFALPGELYAAGGWVLVVLGCGLAGGVAEGAWRRLRVSTDLGTVLELAVVLVLAVQGFSRGDVAGQVAGAAGVVVGTWVVARRVRRWVAAGAPPPEPVAVAAHPAVGSA